MGVLVISKKQIKKRRDNKEKKKGTSGHQWCKHRLYAPLPVVVWLQDEARPRTICIQ